MKSEDLDALLKVLQPHLKLTKYNLFTIFLWNTQLINNFFSLLVKARIKCQYFQIMLLSHSIIHRSNDLLEISIGQSIGVKYLFKDLGEIALVSRKKSPFLVNFQIINN